MFLLTWAVSSGQHPDQNTVLHPLGVWNLRILGWGGAEWMGYPGRNICSPGATPLGRGQEEPGAQNSLQGRGET